MTPLILTAAITGGGPPKARTPHLPCTPREIVDEAIAAWRAGAAIVHLHARLEDGTPTADPAAHRQLVERIRESGCDAILNFSCGDGGGRFGHAQRLALIEQGAEMVSFTASSYNSGARLYDNNPAYLSQACARMQAVGVVPEIEVLEPGFLERIARLVSTGELKAPLYCLLGFGIPGAMPADSALLPILRARLPPGALWGVACAGDHATHLTLQMMAFANGGHVRCGMEDHPWLHAGELARSNAQLVAQWVTTASAWGRPVATPAKARQLLGIEACAAALRAQALA